MISLSLFIRRSDIQLYRQPHEEVITSFYIEQNSRVSCYGVVTNNVSRIVLVWTLRWKACEISKFRHFDIKAIFSYYCTF